MGLFTGITTVLFPLSVIKTQQMSSPTSYVGFAGALKVAKNIKRRDGYQGFYRGFATVVTGAIPVRSRSVTSVARTKPTSADVQQQLQVVAGG